MTHTTMLLAALAAAVYGREDTLIGPEGLLYTATAAEMRPAGVRHGLHFVALIGPRGTVVGKLLGRSGRNVCVVTGRLDRDGQTQLTGCDAVWKETKP